MTPKHLKQHLLAAACLLGVGLTAQNIPTLPEGAYPEWSADKAWQIHSQKRSKVSINGLWQFTSQKNLDQYETKTIMSDDLDGHPASSWYFHSDQNVTVTASSDTTDKTSGKASMKFELEVKPGANFFHVTKKHLDDLPTLTPIAIQFDAKAELERGAFSIEIQDAKGWDRFITAGAAYDFSKPGWKTYSSELMLPKGTTSLRFIVTRSQGTVTGIKGTLWLDNFKIVRTTRKSVIPSLPEASRPWGYAKVPGSWTSTAYPHANDKVKLSETKAAWLRRTADIPKDWSGRDIFIEGDRASTNATVYVNGQRAGELDYFGGKINITPFVTPGQKADILVLVESRHFWEVDPILFRKPSKVWQQRSNCRGISGDLFLTSEPQSQTKLGLTRIITTVKDMNLALKADVSASDGTTLDYTITIAEHQNPKAQTQFSGKATVKDGQLQLNAHWPQAKLWDIHQPNLYDLKLAVSQNGQLLDETLPIRFGFRDFRIVGKDLYLNGIKINLQTATIWTRSYNWHTKDAIRHWIKKAKRDHFTYIYLDEQNRPDYFDVERHFLQVCDEEGMLAGISPISVRKIGIKSSYYDELWNLWCRHVKHSVDKAINHPSLVFWRMNMNLNCYEQDQNPLLLDGKTPFRKGSHSEMIEKVALRTNAYVRSLDPTRPTYNHACGKIGELYTLNNYLGWPELQDLREWLRVWSTSGTQPLMMAEQATPYPGDFQMRDPKVWWRNEPIMTEYGAIILGDKAYELEEDDYVDYIPTIWRPKSKTWEQSYNYFCSYFPPILDTASAIYYEAMLPAWRTWGLNAGNNAWENTFRRPYKRKPGSEFRFEHPPVTLKTDWANLQQPGITADKWTYTNGGGGEIRTYFDLDLPDDKDYYEPTIRGTLYPYLISPLFAYIAGPKDAWYTVEHAFTPGETIAKSVIILNDTRSEQSFTLAWKVTDAQGNVHASGSDKATVQPAEQARLSFAFKAPALAAARNDLTITADVRCNGKQIKVKPFQLQVLPAQAPITAPAGWYALGADNALGSDVQGLKIITGNAIPADAKVMVIAQGALSSVASTPVFADLRARVQQGLQVLVMQQTPEDLNKVFGLRAFTPGSRFVNIRIAGHPFLDSVKPEDLRDWRGASPFVPLAKAPKNLDQRQRASRVWRCSQEGIVASTIIEKPHTSSFRPILDTGFDLRYAALAECPEGQGAFVFCQLDLVGRTTSDPTARRILGNLVSTLTQKHQVPQTAVHLLRRDSQETAEQLRTRLERGETIVACGVTPAMAGRLAQAAGNSFAFMNGMRWKNLLPKALPSIFAGVSPAEIHWRLKLKVPVLNRIPANAWKNASGVLAVIPAHRGQIVWLPAAPEDFNAAMRPDLIYSRVVTERLLSIVLTNLNANSTFSWADALQRGSAKEADHYTDKRIERDDPYAYMRW